MSAQATLVERGHLELPVPAQRRGWCGGPISRDYCSIGPVKPRRSTALRLWPGTRTVVTIPARHWISRRPHYPDISPPTLNGVCLDTDCWARSCMPHTSNADRNSGICEDISPVAKISCTCVGATVRAPSGKVVCQVRGTRRRACQPPRWRGYWIMKAQLLGAWVPCEPLASSNRCKSSHDGDLPDRRCQRKARRRSRLWTQLEGLLVIRNGRHSRHDNGQSDHSSMQAARKTVSPVVLHQIILPLRQWLRKADRCPKCNRKKTATYQNHPKSHQAFHGCGAG